jgi:hypothetical protein
MRAMKATIQALVQPVREPLRPQNSRKCPHCGKSPAILMRCTECGYLGCRVCIGLSYPVCHGTTREVGG